MRNALYILAILMLFAGSVNAQEANPDILRMKAALAGGSYAQVTATNINPPGIEDKAQYFITKGQAELEQGNYWEAEQHFLKVEELFPGRASINLARLYAQSGNKDLLFTYLEKHLKSGYKIKEKDIMLDPSFSRLDSDRDWIRFWSGDWYSKEEDLLAEARYRIKKNDFDLSFWNDLSLIEPASPGILAVLADYHAGLGEYRKAGQLFEKALELEPENIEAGRAYAAFYIERGKYSDAVDIYKGLMALYPYDITNYIHYASTLLKSGQSDLAAREMDRLGELGIDASGLNLMFAREIVNEDPDQALIYLDPVISESPSAEAFNLRATANTKMNNIQNAISDYSMSLDINPKQADVYFNRAELRLSYGDREGACYDWQRALTLGHRKAQDMLHKYCR